MFVGGVIGWCVLIPMVLLLLKFSLFGKNRSRR